MDKKEIIDLLLEYIDIVERQLELMRKYLQMIDRE